MNNDIFNIELLDQDFNALKNINLYDSLLIIIHLLEAVKLLTETSPSIALTLMNFTQIIKDKLEITDTQITNFQNELSTFMTE
jgi:hypothetical protein